MKVFRLSKKVYAKDLSGKGAAKSGGRWNSKGVPMLYTSANRALCILEVAVHLPFGILPTEYYMTEISFPRSLKMKTLDPKTLKRGWDNFPAQESTQAIGDKFIQENIYCVLEVNSAIVYGEKNYVFNPLHKDFNKIKIIKSYLFNFDKRLFIL